MANCPNCGSEHIQLRKDTNVDWGRAVAGWALFGVVGGAVGAVTGEDRNANACLDCGTSWRAADLYNVLQIIKKYTGISLNLSHEKDRNFMNDFMSEIIPYIKATRQTEENLQVGIKIMTNSLQSEILDKMFFFLIAYSICLMLFFTTMALLMVIVNINNIDIFIKIGSLFSFCSLFVSPVIGSILDKKYKNFITKKISKQNKI